MIYVDSSVALAHLLAEDRSPPESFWQGELISSRLLEYEVWTRIHAGKLLPTHGEHQSASNDRRPWHSQLSFEEIVVRQTTTNNKPRPV